MTPVWLNGRKAAALACALLLLGIVVASAAPVRIHVAGITPCQSSPIALTPSGLRLINVNPDANSISVFDVSTDNPVKLREIPVGLDPRSVAVHPNGNTVYVANALSNNIAVVDLNLGQRRPSIAVGSEPMALTLSPNGTRLYVANSASNNLMVFNTSTSQRVATVDLSAFGTAPRAIGVTNDTDADDTDETIFVSLFFAQLRPGKTSLDEGQDDAKEGRVVAISAATNTVLGVASLGPMAATFNGNLGTGFNSNGRLAPGNGLTPAVTMLNPQAFTTPTGAFPNQLASVAIQPGQNRAYVVSTGASPNGPLRFNSNVQGLVSVFNTSTLAEITASQTAPVARQTAPLNLNQGTNLATTPAPRFFNSNPVAMTWRPNGADAWVAVQQADTIVRLTTDAGGVPTISAPLVAGPSQIVRVDLQAVGAGQIPGKAPRGIAINGTGTRAYVSNFISRSVSVVDISNPTSPALVGTGLSTALPPAGSRADTVLLGEELFFTGRGPQGRMSSEAWGSCGSCHPDGLTDNVTWMFEAGPRQTIPLDGTFNNDPRPLGDHFQRILNWSAVRDENQDFELNTRGVSGGRGLIDDDRLFFAFGGASGAGPTNSALIEQFQQFTGAVSATDDLAGGAALPVLPTPRREYGVATLSDDRVYIIGGRTGSFPGTLINGPDTVLEYNPRTNVIRGRSSVGFTPRHSLGAAAVKTSQGERIYAVGGYAADPPSSSANPTGLVQEYNPATDTWRTVASLPTPVAQFGITAAGGVNTAEPLQLIHVVSGNGGSEAAPSVVGGGSIVQRFQPDPTGPGTWSAFSVAGLTPRRNHGAATVLRGVQSRVFSIGGQDAGGTVLGSVEEYLAQAVVMVAVPHTDMPSPRALFGISSSLSTNQIYIGGGADSTFTDTGTIFEYTVGNQGPVAGPPGTPSGTWVIRGNLSVPRRGLGLSTPPGVTNFLPFRSSGRDADQDAIAAWLQDGIRSLRSPIVRTDPLARTGRTLFGTTGLIVSGFNCATCHGGQLWTRSRVAYPPPPSPEVGIGLGSERVIGAELRQTLLQPNTPTPGPGVFPGVLLNVGTFTPNSAGGRVNEIRVNPADPGQAIAPLGANGFNIPSLLSLHATPPYFYSGLAPTLDQVLDGSQDGNGGTRHHFVANPAQRAALIQFLRSIDQTTPPFP